MQQLSVISAPPARGASRRLVLKFPAVDTAQPVSATIPAATTVRRKRGLSLFRRIGQSGSVFQHGHPKKWEQTNLAYGRYWVDVGQERKRRTVPLGICPTKSDARRKLREYIETSASMAKKRSQPTPHRQRLFAPKQKSGSIHFPRDGEAGQTRHRFRLAARSR